MSFFNPLYGYLSLLLSLLLLVPQLFKPYLCGINFSVCNITHILCYLLVSKLMILVHFNCWIELLEMFIWPVPCFASLFFVSAGAVSNVLFGFCKSCSWRPRFICWSILIFIFLALLLFIQIYHFLNIFLEITLLQIRTSKVQARTFIYLISFILFYYPTQLIKLYPLFCIRHLQAVMVNLNVHLNKFFQLKLWTNFLSKHSQQMMKVFQKVVVHLVWFAFSMI